MVIFYNFFRNPHTSILGALQRIAHRKGLIVFLILCMQIRCSYAQTDLTVNGGAELPPIGNGWTATGTDFGFDPTTYPSSGQWFMTNTNTYSPGNEVGDSHGGNAFFSSGINRIPGGVTELFQDINVTRYTGSTGATIVPFVLDAFLATDGLGDDARLIVELRNGVGGVLATPYDSRVDIGGPFPVHFWFESNPNINTVAGTIIVRIRLIGTNSGPGTLHAFFDDISFVTNALPLPVGLLSFQGVQNPDHTVSLIWRTAQEQNSHYTEVQRSADGKNFLSIGKVPAAGNSQTVRSYSYTDGSPLAGSGSYRLRLVDLDGRAAYSRVVVVVNTGALAGGGLELLGNPFHDHIGLRISMGDRDRLLLTLMDMQGRVVLRQENAALPGANFIDVYPPAGLAEGIWLLNVRGATMNQTIRVFRQ